MTVGGNSPHDLGAELPPPDVHAPAAFPQAGAPWPAQPPVAQAQRRGVLLTTGIAGLALAMATGAMVVALTRHPDPIGVTSSTSASATDTSAANKALCTAISPAMADSEKITNTYIRLGTPGSPERDAALPKFVSDTKEWVERAQNAIDSHPDAGGYLRRSLQQYTDQSQTLALSLTPGPLKPYTEQLYQSTSAVYDGPVAICQNLGVKW